MKKMKIVPLVMAILLLCFSSAWAEKPSIELGEKLFNNPRLGASMNDTSCASCHPGGKGMEKAGANPRLAKMINMCIRGPLKGEPLNEETVAMQSLKMYLKSLAK